MRRGVPGDEGREARFAGVPGLQADLREAQEVTESAPPWRCDLVRRRRVIQTGSVGADVGDSAFCSSHPRNRRAWVTGAGHSSWIAAFNSAPIMIANPRKNANSRNAIGVASAP